MIIDKLENANLYSKLNENLAYALEYLQSTDFSKMEIGKYVINEDKIYAIVSDYITKDKKDAFFEAHEIYADVQFVVSGSENFGYAPFYGQELHKEYDKENDYKLFDIESDYFILKEGMFAILFTNELHKPGIKINHSENVRKVVVKVKL